MRGPMFLLWRTLPLMLLFVASCTAMQVTYLPTPTTKPTATIRPTVMQIWPATHTPPAPLATSALAAPTPLPTQTMIAQVTKITPVVSAASLQALEWSPDSHWLPFIDTADHTLHFLEAVQSSACTNSIPVSTASPDQLLSWLPNGRVVFQAPSSVLAGQPCAAFAQASLNEMLALQHHGPSFSPDGRFQVIEAAATTGQTDLTTNLSIKDVTDGKIVSEIAFSRLPDSAPFAGYWLDNTHFLIPASTDQGPVLITPGKPPVQIAPLLFHMPHKPGSGENDYWTAISAQPASKDGPFYLGLVSSAQGTTSNPFQIYNSQTGALEHLPYSASQAAFSNDGHWLLVTQLDRPDQFKTLIRALDAPGASFQDFYADPNLVTWSPDGSLYQQISADQSTLALFTTEGQDLLGAWSMTGYELSPTWSPDGTRLSIEARNKTDNQQAIFIIQVPKN